MADYEYQSPGFTAEGVEPPASLKSEGFQVGYKPPAAYFTWFWTRVSRCITELQNKLSGAAVKDLSNVDDAAFRSKSASAGAGGIQVVSASSSDGVAYTAKMNGVTALSNGLTLTIIPDISSTSTAPTLNVNGLGAIPVRLPLSFNTAAATMPKLANFFTAGRPVTVQYDASYVSGGVWKTLDKQKTSAQDLYGTVPIESGGTGATTAADARNSLGVTPENIGAATSGHTHALTASAITGTLPVEKGGTGATTAAAARSALGVTPANIGAATEGHEHALTSDKITGTLPITKGGTGSTTAAAARTALGVTPANIGAAAQSAFEYSTAEVTTAAKWLDGKTIYRKVFQFGAVAAGGSTNIETGLGTSLDTVVSLRGMARLADANYVVPLPYADSNTTYLYRVQIYEANTAPKIGVGAGASGGAGFSSGFVVMEYTKD